MRKAVLTGARLQVEDLERGGYRWDAIMITTTYAPESPWSAGDITGLVHHIRQWCRRREIQCRYQWVLELTEAGRPHYHLIVIVPHGVFLPKPDDRGWWPLGTTRIEAARNPVGYLAKYASKGLTGLKRLPHGARLHGGGGLDAASRQERSWWLLPRWVRESFAIADRAIKVKGGYLARLSGEFLASPWVLVERCSEWSWVRIVHA